MTIKSYPAIRVRQTSEAGDLVLFAAPATDIDEWAGVPQRERLGGDETVGFQREENPKRLEELRDFYADPHNVIQNPLLCATRNSSRVVFEATGNSTAAHQLGQLTIEHDNLSSFPLLALLQRLKSDIETRLPELADAQVRVTKINRLKERLNDEHPTLTGQFGEFLVDDEIADASADADADVSDDSEESLGIALLAEETHILDFWEEIAARIQVLNELGIDFTGSSFLGFSKDAVISYLQPIVLVDGQHRLQGAILAARDAVNEEGYRDDIETAIEEGKDPDDVTAAIAHRRARQLPVSLLLEASPAEHVFQFVVVNQKATPIGRALLGTIVSTSLTSEELKTVSDRLTAAGIPLEDSKAIAYLTRHPSSPFQNLVDRGLSGDGSDLLQWNVLASLVRIFRELKGGKLFHEKNDYADKWRRDHLNTSDILSSCPDEQPKLACWRELNGPWRDIFIAFWTAVRDQLATTNDPEAGNYWGSPRNSNLFNKVSLTILAADFFQFMCDRGYNQNSTEEVKDFVSQWLYGVKSTYFSRDWKLAGVKKDNTGTKAQWAYLWVQYRKDPVQLPSLAQFRHQRPT